MKRTVLVLCSVVLVGLLLAGCGGGGGVTPPPADEVSKLFPLTVGRTWTMDYSETSHEYLKMTGDIARLSLKRSHIGPFTVAISLPKFLPGARQRESHTYEETTDRTETGTDVSTITRTMTDPFPTEVSEDEAVMSGQWTETWKKVLDGATTQGSNSGTSEDKDRSFYTNENGEVKLWGEQHWNEQTATWGDIKVFPNPWLMFKAGATSWTVGHIEEDLGEGTSFSANMVAQLAGKETVTVPAGTFQCYKVVYTLQNVQPTWPSNYQVSNWKLDMTMTVWLALDVGMVKSEDKHTLEATFKDTTTGATGSISSTSTHTSSLKSYK